MHWIVDGMNVIGSRPDGWWKDRRQAMGDLVESLDRWAETLPADDNVTVVFERKPLPPIDSQIVVVGFAPRAQPDSADDEIVQLVCDGGGNEITVVTSDARLSSRARDGGAAIWSAGHFRRVIDSACDS